MYLGFILVPGESCWRRLRSLLCLCDIFPVPVNSLVCWFSIGEDVQVWPFSKVWIQGFKPSGSLKIVLQDRPYGRLEGLCHSFLHWLVKLESAFYAHVQLFFGNRSLAHSKFWFSQFQLPSTCICQDLPILLLSCFIAFLVWCLVTILHHKTFLVQLYWHLAIKLYCIVLSEIWIFYILHLLPGSFSSVSAAVSRQCCGTQPQGVQPLPSVQWQGCWGRPVLVTEDIHS